jgi:hypothetical protein
VPASCVRASELRMEEATRGAQGKQDAAIQEGFLATVGMTWVYFFLGNKTLDPDAEAARRPSRAYIRRA